MRLRDVDAAKIFIQKDLDCRFVTTKPLQGKSGEKWMLDCESQGAEWLQVKAPCRERSIQIHCATNGDNCLQRAKGVSQDKFWNNGS